MTAAAIVAGSALQRARHAAKAAGQAADALRDSQPAVERACAQQTLAAQDALHTQQEAVGHVNLVRQEAIGHVNQVRQEAISHVERARQESELARAQAEADVLRLERQALSEISSRGRDNSLMAQRLLTLKMPCHP